MSGMWPNQVLQDLADELSEARPIRRRDGQSKRYDRA
jgi:hypothetical protein